MQNRHTHPPSAFPEERAVSHSTWASQAPQGLLKASVKSAAWEGPGQGGEKGSLLTFAQGADEAGAAETLALAGS